MKFRYSFWGMQIILRLPGIMFNSKSFPFNQVAQFPVDDFAVQDLLHNPFLFSIYNLQEWRGKGMLSTYGVFRGQCQLDYVENRMKAAHGGGKSETVCAISDLLDYGESVKAITTSLHSRSVLGRVIVESLTKELQLKRTFGYE